MEKDVEMFRQSKLRETMKHEYEMRKNTKLMFKGLYIFLALSASYLFFGWLLTALQTHIY